MQFQLALLPGTNQDRIRDMNLTEHLLTCLSEEASEIIKDVCKSLRFGLEDRNVLDPTGPTNRERIVNELKDFMAIVEMLEAEGIIPLCWESYGDRDTKKEKVRKFIEYAKGKGSLTL